MVKRKSIVFIVLIFLLNKTCSQSETAGDCLCVPYFLCDPVKNELVPNDDIGIGIIIPRTFDECKDPLEVCCKLPMEEKRRNESSNSAGSRDEIQPNFSKCGKWKNGGECVKVNEDDDEDDTECHEEFPWGVSVLNLRNGSFLAAGSLIHPRVVLTVANAISSIHPHAIKIRASRTASDSKTRKSRPKPFQERIVHDVIVHPNFSLKHFQNDLALIVLSAPFVLDDDITTVCLPNQDEDSEELDDCITMWRAKESLERKVKMHTMTTSFCDELFRKTYLGRDHKLHESFVCAGSSSEDDVEVQGIDGVGLVCPASDGKKKSQYRQIGMYSWHLARNIGEIPAAYVYLSKFRNWIDEELKKIGCDLSYCSIDS